MKTFKRILISIVSLPLVVLAALASLLPFRLLRSLWPVVYFLIRTVFGYREKVVAQNLSKAFPQKNSTEISVLSKEYYKNLSQVMLDSIGLISAGKSTVNRLAYFEDPAKGVIEKFTNSGKSFIVATAHYGNWEIVAALSHYKYPGYLVAGYRPMTNFFLNILVYFSRKRFSSKLLALRKMPRQIVELINSGQPMALALIADQWPPPKTATMVNFLGIDTPFYNGIEKISRKYSLPVIFMSARKQPDGKYSVFATEITDNPAALPPKEITRKYASLLENEIKANPAQWLWSHRRWK